MDAPRLPWRETRRTHWFLTLGATALLIAVLIIIACGPDGGSSPVPTLPPDPGPAPASARCRDGLASVDLAGRCRADPPTMGALEACDGPDCGV